MDHFEHFDEEQRSWEHLQQLPPPLRAEAVSIWGVAPDAPIAGLMIENGTSLHPDVAKHFDGAVPDAKEGICGIVPTELARLVIDRHGGPEAARYAQELGDVPTGSLFVVVLTSNGLRFGHVPIWEPTPDDPSTGGADLGDFTITTSRNDELKLIRESVERAKENPVHPGRHFQRIVAKEPRPDGSTFERIKLYAVDLGSGTIVVTESSAGMTYARRTISVDSIG